jgi:hypothetical protein
VNFSQEYSLGYLDLPAGRHELTFTCVGKNPASKGYYLGVDALRIEEITRYFVNPEKK